MFRFINCICICIFLISCASPRSFEDYAIAQEAINAAKRARASQMSPGLYSKARSQFGMGLIAFKNKNYNKANEHFQKSQYFAEKAELISYIKRSQGGSLY